MVVAEDAPAGREGLLVQVAGALEVTEGAAGLSEVSHRSENVVVVVVEYPLETGQGLLVEVTGASEITKVP